MYIFSLLSRAIILLDLTQLIFSSCNSKARFFQYETGKAIAPQISPKFSISAESQIQCILKQKFEKYQCWLLEVKSHSTNKYSCRFFLEDDIDSFVNDADSIIYKQHRSPCRYTQGPGDACYKSFEDCQDIQRKGFRVNGVYDITIDKNQKPVYCDLTGNQGGWTYIQKRISGDTNFNRGWVDYQGGFGNPATNYWLGLDSIYALTKNQTGVLLRVTAEAFDGTKAYAIFKGFCIGDESVKYKLSTGVYVEGRKGNSWTAMDGMFFSTKDAQNDKHVTTDCAVTRQGGGWFKACTWLNMNGRYGADATKNADKYMHWIDFKGHRSLKSIGLSIKRN